MQIKSQFDIGELVYIVTDVEQLKRQIVSFEVQWGGSILYILQCGERFTKHYAIELSRSKIVE